MSQFGLLNRRSRFAKLPIELNEPRIFTDQRFEKIGRFVLEVLKGKSVGTLFFQGLGTFAIPLLRLSSIARGVRIAWPVSYKPPPRLLFSKWSLVAPSAPP